MRYEVRAGAAAGSVDGNGAGENGASDADVLAGQVEQLQEALQTRDVIGQAKGILMERYRIDPEDAFLRLRTASQHTNRKLREVAAELARTGEWPPAGAG